MVRLLLKSCLRKVLLLALAIFAVQGLAPVRAGVLMQGFYTDVPSPAANTPTAS